MQRQEFLKVLTDKLIEHGFERTTLGPGEERYRLNTLTIVTDEGRKCVACMTHNNTTWSLIHESGDWKFFNTKSVFVGGYEFPLIGPAAFYDEEDAIKNFLEMIDRMVQLAK
jgi:hypothetical protein